MLVNFNSSIHLANLISHTSSTRSMKQPLYLLYSWHQFSILCFLSILLLPLQSTLFSVMCILIQLNLQSQPNKTPASYLETFCSKLHRYFSLSLYVTCLSGRGMFTATLLPPPYQWFTSDSLEVFKTKWGGILETHSQKNQIRMSEDKTWALLFLKIFTGDFYVP